MGKKLNNFFMIGEGKNAHLLNLDNVVDISMSEIIQHDEHLKEVVKYCIIYSDISGDVICLSNTLFNDPDDIIQLLYDIIY